MQALWGYPYQCRGCSTCKQSSSYYYYYHKLLDLLLLLQWEVWTLTRRYHYSSLILFFVNHSTVGMMVCLRSKQCSQYIWYNCGNSFINNRNFFNASNVIKTSISSSKNRAGRPQSKDNKDGVKLWKSPTTLLRLILLIWTLPPQASLSTSRGCYLSFQILPANVFFYY